MWSKRNCIGSLDWFHPIKQWHRTVAQCIYTRNARSSECEIARKRTDHSEFHVKIHVAMINLSVQIVVNISIPKMLQLEVRFSFRLEFLAVAHTYHALSLTHCISWFSSSICRQWNKFSSVFRCSVCSWRHWQNRELRENYLDLTLPILVQFVHAWTCIRLSVLVLNIT